MEIEARIEGYTGFNLTRNIEKAFKMVSHTFSIFPGMKRAALLKGKRQPFHLDFPK